LDGEWVETMNRGKRCSMWWLGVTACAGLLAGCVERRFVIYTDPPGAVAYESGRPLGAAPADDHFVYYGTYHFTLVRDGYQTLQVDECLAPPWYEYPGLDFISENLIPWTIRDVRRFTYQMVPLQVPNTRELLEQGGALRGRGQAIQAPPSASVAAPPAPVPIVPVPPAVPAPPGP
jgi:hypothetical protein